MITIKGSENAGMPPQELMDGIVVGGYAVYEVASLDQAKEWTRRFLDLHVRHWKGSEGEAEIRPVMDPTAFGPGGDGH